jgi:ferritin-like metal-binding protein YciE
MTTSNPSMPAVVCSERSPLGGISECARIFEIHAVLQEACSKAIDQCQSSVATVTQQRGDFDELSEWLRRFETHLHEARNHVERLGVAFDRIKIVALNTGLEGARLGDLAGKALVAVSDELRSLTSRGLDILSEQATTIEQLETERQRLLALGERSENQVNDVEARLRDALSAQHTSQTELQRLATALQQSTGLDVEAAARVSRITEQARNLAELLDGLSTEHRKVTHAALAPALGPIVTWLAKDPDSLP